MYVQGEQEEGRLVTPKGKAGKGKLVSMPGKIKAVEFMVPTNDSRGHNARVGFRVPPEMKREIAIVIAKAPETGWTTDTDFWRWAGRLAINYMTTLINDDRLSNLNRQVRAMESVLADQQQLVDFNQIFTDQEKIVHAMMADGADEEARQALLKLERLIGEMDDDAWRRRWQKRFQQKFGHMVRGAELAGESGEDRT